MKKIIESLPPVIEKDTTTLIVGVMPGEQSSQEQRYYENPRNKFWKIISFIYNEGNPFASYEGKINMLKKHKAGLFCVLKTCERKGSTIDKIRNETYNDFEHLLKLYPNIKTIIFNGKKNKYYSKINCMGKTTKYLPSTSSTNTYKTLEEKKIEWKAALKENV